MLNTLRIKNLALVADMTLELQAGFNAITGETGAGKSILIGALNLVLGERADRTAIRAGCEQCSVEAVFDIGRLQAPLGELLAQNGLEPCEDRQLVLKRIFTQAGANRQFVNGSPTTLTVLRALGDWLVDIHGPHDHQSLLQPIRQLEILDAYAKLESRREAFGEQVRRRQQLLAQKASLIVDERTNAQQIDLLRFQVAEITQASLQPEEDAQVEQDYQRASNAARLLQLTQSALGLLQEDEPSLAGQAGTLGRLLLDLQKLDPGAGALVATHQQVTEGLRELTSQLSHYADQIDLDTGRLAELENRLNLIQTLKRKYGSTVEEVLEFGRQALEKLRQLENREAEAARLQAELDQLDKELWRCGQELTNQRKRAIPGLSKAVARQLADLGFKQSLFEISLQSVTPPSAGSTPSFSSQGLDAIEFQFAPNPGEPARALRAIASSGELARVMLALKTVLAAEDRVPVLVFDEVDANVGGETAHAVGQKMREIGRQRQVLCITHLAPVAASAATHFIVQKQTQGGRTTTNIDGLDKAQRIAELARMLGGQTPAARHHAESLLSQSP